MKNGVGWGGVGILTRLKCRSNSRNNNKKKLLFPILNDIKSFDLLSKLLLFVLIIYLRRGKEVRVNIQNTREFIRNTRKVKEKICHIEKGLKYVL